VSNDEGNDGAESQDSARFINKPTTVAAPRRGRGEDPYIGSTVADRYRVIKKLGEGGMGVVYLAEHVFIEKKVALKILSEDFARKADLVARFMQEAKAASKIGHENIVDITDFGEIAHGSVFFAMEYLPGGDLASHIRHGGPMPFARARPIMNQVCRALAAAHSKGIIHRDMKPENIFLIDREGKADFVKILDFGIAKMNAVDDGGERLTRTGMIFGTPEYMSPEQARGDRPDHRVDIYAAGCILYEMLTGDVPFHAETFMGVLTKHMFDEPDPPSQRAPDMAIPPELDAVVLKALAKDRDERYETMKEMALALERCVGGDPLAAWGAQETSGVYPHRAPRSDPSRKPGATAIAAPRGTKVGAPPSRAARTLAVAGSVAALAGGIAYFAMRQAPRPVEQPLPRPVVAAPPVLPDPPRVEVPAPPEKRVCKVFVSSSPSGAEVWIGEERLGVTPLKIEREESGEATWMVRKKGFADHPLHVNVSGPTRDYHSELVPTRRSGEKRPAPTHASSSAPTPDPRPVPAAAAPAPKADGKLRDLKDPFVGH
jgi:serine/threonine-protein kinase